MNLFDERIHAFLISGETFLGKGMVDAVVDAVASEDEIGFGLGKRAIKSFVYIGSWKRMDGFGQSAEGF